MAATSSESLISTWEAVLPKSSVLSFPPGKGKIREIPFEEKIDSQGGETYAQTDSQTDRQTDIRIVTAILCFIMRKHKQAHPVGADPPECACCI